MKLPSKKHISLLGAFQLNVRLRKITCPMGCIFVNTHFQNKDEAGLMSVILRNRPIPIDQSDFGFRSEL